MVFLHLWDGHLLRLTEQQLIAEAVLVGEAWRVQMPAVPGEAAEPNAPFAPVEPVLELSYDLQPPAGEPRRFAALRDGPAWRAGANVQPLIERAQRVNLSAARVLDAAGCVVATTGEDLGACLDGRPEVDAALAGHYAAIARRRIREDPTPPLTGIGRRGDVRVFSALPVKQGERVIGAVYMSRTSSSPLEVVWKQRQTVFVGFGLCLLLMGAVTLLFSRMISRPLRGITAAAAAVARGDASAGFGDGGMVPAEIDALRDALGRMTGQLTDRAAYISGFAANVSHELKTPITAIRGAVELLRDDWEGMEEEQRCRFLQHIDADANRMERLVTRLLHLARIQNTPDAAARIEVPPFFQALASRYADRVRLDLTQAPASIVMNHDHLESRRA